MLSQAERNLFKKEIESLIKEDYDMEFYEPLFKEFKDYDVEEKIIKEIIKIEAGDVKRNTLSLCKSNYKIMFSVNSKFSFKIENLDTGYTQDLVEFEEILQRMIRLSNNQKKVLINLALQINSIASMMYLIYLKIHTLHVDNFSLCMWKRFVN